MVWQKKIEKNKKVRKEGLPMGALPDHLTSAGKTDFRRLTSMAAGEQDGTV